MCFYWQFCYAINAFYVYTRGSRKKARDISVSWYTLIWTHQILCRHELILSSTHISDGVNLGNPLCALFQCSRPRYALFLSTIPGEQKKVEKCQVEIFVLQWKYMYKKWVMMRGVWFWVWSFEVGLWPSGNRNKRTCKQFIILYMSRLCKYHVYI